MVDITYYFKGSFEPPILCTETLVPKSCTYQYYFFGNRNPFQMSLSLSTKKNQNPRAFSWRFLKLKISSFWGSSWKDFNKSRWYGLNIDSLHKKQRLLSEYPETCQPHKYIGGKIRVPRIVKHRFLKFPLPQLRTRST